MNAARLVSAVVVKLATVAGFVALAMDGKPGWGLWLLPLFLLTRTPRA